MKNQYNPDWTSPPGDTILDILEEKNIGLSELMDKLDIPIYDVHLLMIGRIPINDDIAQKLSEFLGGSKQFWINRENNYKTNLKRKLDEVICKK